MASVFLSYRREDSQPYAERLCDRLNDLLGGDSVFIDIDSIRPGDDFGKTIDHTLEQCAVVLVVIGPRWLEIADGHGQLRLNNPKDFHRLEIERALQRGIRVIPVLVGGAVMPSESCLPDSIKDFAGRHAV